MILDSITTPVKVVGAGSTSSFSIAMNGKAFRVLSDTLYQNKIGSIVREVSCNAYDAHVMKGNTDVPFEIHLPDAFEPHFSIQDFGVGLSPEDVRTVFTVYFQSTKDQSNDTIGAFGLGAKTPFSYTDQFTISSVKNNLRTVYNAFITESGVPDIAVLFEEQTTDASGVEIRLSVKREDYARFNSEVIKQLAYFKVKPVLLNTDNKFVQKADYTIQTESVGIREITYGDRQIMIVQGNVAYPLILNSIQGKIKKENSEILDRLSNYQVDMFFKIGQIGVTASREAIEYNATTLANIDTVLDNVRAELNKLAEEKVQSLSTDWERAIMINSGTLLHAFTTGNIVPSAKLNILNSKYSFDLRSVLTTESKSITGGTISTSIGGFRRYTTYRMGDGYAANTSMFPDNDLVILLKDTSVRFKERIKFYLEQKKIGSVHVIEMNDSVYDDALVQKIKDALGGFSNIVRMTSIVLPKRVTASRTGVKNSNYYEADLDCHSLDSLSSWDKMYDDLTEIDDDILYIEIPVGAKSVSGDVSNLIHKLHIISEIETDVPRLVAIRTSKTEKIKDKKNFITLKSFVDEKIKKYNTEEIKTMLRKKQVAGSVTSNIGYTYGHIHKFLQKEAPDHELCRVLNVVMNRGKKGNTCTNSDKISSLIGFEAYHHANNARLKCAAMIEKVKQSYPLIHNWSSYADAKTQKHYVEYLVAVENFRKQAQKLQKV